MNAQARMTWEESVNWLRNQPGNDELVRHCFYDDPITAAAKRYYESSEWRAVRIELPPDVGVVLDVGAGRGISSYALARDGWKVTALEPDTGELVGSGAIGQLVRETGVEIKVVNEWGESLPFPAQSFDLVYCRAVLHHARDLGRLCVEIERVLKPGGYLIATREHVISDKADLPAFFDSHPLHRLYGGENAYLLEEYKSAIRCPQMRLKKVFNPLQSDINLFPETVVGMKSRFGAKLKIVPGWLIPDFMLRIYGEMDRTPGRLYSFIARKAS